MMDTAKMVPVVPRVPLPIEAIGPMTSVHPAVCAWRVLNPAFALSLIETEAVCFALIEREEERAQLYAHGSTADWASAAGKF